MCPFISIPIIGWVLYFSHHVTLFYFLYEYLYEYIFIICFIKNICMLMIQSLLTRK